MLSEEELLTLLKQNDRKAQRTFYERYSPYAAAVAARYVADSEAVGDVLQESFIKMFKALPRFRLAEKGLLRAWVGRVVANESVSWMKRERRTDFASIGVETLPDLPEPEPDVGNVPLETLQTMISHLPDGYRTVFNLYVMEQLSHKEIAAMLGIKPDTSASQYARAKRLLARWINDYRRNEK